MIDEKAFEDFCRFERMGIKNEAKSAALSFVKAFSNFEEKASWSKRYLVEGEQNHTIRHEIYEGVIFPVLLVGYQKRDPWALKWLAKTSQNIYKSQVLSKLIDDKTEGHFLEEWLKVEPNNKEAIELFIDCEKKWLAFCIHEWPSGILYGMDGATIEECLGILRMVDRLRVMDSNPVSKEFYRDVENKVKTYIERLREKKDESPSVEK